MTNEKAALEAMARMDFYVFARMMFPVLYPGEFDEARYLHLLAATLMRVATQPGRRQIINMPPRHLKSYFATVALTAWLLGLNPGLTVMIASHTMALSSSHLRNVRTLMKSELYGRVFPTRIGGKDSETEMETTEGGRVLAVSFEAAPTGRGCDCLIIDDPLKASDACSGDALNACEAFYYESLFNRLNHPTQGFVLVVMQRLAQGDLSGRLSEAGAFEQLALPLAAIEAEQIEYEDITGCQRFTRKAGDLLNPQRMGQADLEELKAQCTDAVFAAQYQQRPLAAGGNLVKADWLACADTPLRARLVVQSWDTATATSEKACYSVCTTWRVAGDRFELVDVFRKRLSPDEIGDVAVALAERHQAKVVLVEEANVGYMLDVILKRVPGLEVVRIRPNGSKEARVQQCLGAFQQRMVLLPLSADWLSDYREELLAFPNGRHADQVDSTSMFLNWALPRAMGEVRDPAFRQHRPTVTGVSAGFGGAVMRIGGRSVRPGQPFTLRPRRGW